MPASPWVSTCPPIGDGAAPGPASVARSRQPTALPNANIFASTLSVFATPPAPPGPGRRRGPAEDCPPPHPGLPPATRRQLRTRSRPWLRAPPARETVCSVTPSRWASTLAVWLLAAISARTAGVVRAFLRKILKAHLLNPVT